jgi:hypothetical protein
MTLWRSDLAIAARACMTAYGDRPAFPPLVQAIARAIAAERAACALLADDLCAPNVAKMIRARGVERR